MVYEVTGPRSHKTISMIAIVSSILLQPYLFTESRDLCGLSVAVSRVLGGDVAYRRDIERIASSPPIPPIAASQSILCVSSPGMHS
jgi:hypothetical protein